VERLYGIDIQVVRIFFSVRYALGYKVVKHPSVVADSGIGHQLCLLKSGKLYFRE